MTFCPISKAKLTFSTSCRAVALFAEIGERMGMAPIDAAMTVMDLDNARTEIAHDEGDGPPGLRAIRNTERARHNAKRRQDSRGGDNRARDDQRVDVAALVRRGKCRVAKRGGRDEESAAVRNLDRRYPAHGASLHHRSAGSEHSIPTDGSNRRICPSRRLDTCEVIHELACAGRSVGAAFVARAISGVDARRVTQVDETLAVVPVVGTARSVDVDVQPRPCHDAAAGEDRLHDAARPGEIVDQAGAVLGRHDGIFNFTVGQRKGLGLSGNEEPLFVLKLDAARAQVVVGPRSALASRVIDLHSVNWLGSADAPFDCAVKVRSMRPPVAARVTPLAGNAARVELASAEEAVAPGQACVFYSAGDGPGRVLGGGWIKPAETVRTAAE